jgi:hypothetical protein
MIFKNEIASDTFIEISDGIITMASGANSISTTRDGANFINGPISFSSPFTNMRLGGIYKFNSLMMATMPSTMVTPIPTLTLDLPVAEAASMAALTALILSTVT